jgi:3-deoxy-D-manno-octulosonate 8-phosphate phosphatase (KDO 8-P phosphatase)
MNSDKNFLSLFSRIRVFVFDIDGVLTDGSLQVTEDGDELRTMNIKDGYAIVQAIRHQHDVVIISGSGSEGVRRRLERLGVRYIYMGVQDKLNVLTEWTLANHVKPENVLYMGDDMPDIQAMRSVGLSACPADAVQEILETAQYISPFNGGKGCVRDVIEKVLKLKGVW